MDVKQNQVRQTPRARTQALQCLANALASCSERAFVLATFYFIHNHFYILENAIIILFA